MRFTQNLAKNLMGKPAVPPLGQPYTFPAPTGGWNARDPLAAMAPNDAVQLDNYIPTTGDARLRGGSMPFATGMPAQPVETLVEYSSGGADELWAIAGGNIYNVSTKQLYLRFTSSFSFCFNYSFSYDFICASASISGCLVLLLHTTSH